jgi:hypothetical protein
MKIFGKFKSDKNVLDGFGGVNEKQLIKYFTMWLACT